MTTAHRLRALRHVTAQSVGGRARAVTLLAILSCCAGASAATPASGQPRAAWMPPFTIASPPATGCAGPDYSTVRLAGNAAGEAVAIWTGSVGTQVVVQAAVRRPGAAAFDALQTLTPPGNGNLNLNPTVAIDRLGNAAAVWVRLGATGSSMLQAAFRPAGGQFGPPRDVSANASQSAEDAPDLGVDEQGNFTLIWRQIKTELTITPPRPDNIRSAVRPAQGEFGPSVFLAGTLDYVDTSLGGAGLFAGSGPSIAVNGAGDTLATWWYEAIDSSLPAYVRQPQASAHSAGAGFGPPAVLDTYEFSDEAPPRAALDAQGNAVIAWSVMTGPLPAGEPHMGVWAAQRPAGGPVGAPNLLAPYTDAGSEPEVTIDAQGAATVVWTGIEGSAGRIRASVRPPGQAFGAAQTLSPAGVSAFRPVAAADGQGNTFVAWNAQTGPSAIGLQVASRPPGGSFGGAQTLSGSGEAVNSPQLAFAENGDGVAAWLDEAYPECPTVRAAVFSPAPTQGAGTTTPPSGNSTPTPTASGMPKSVGRLKVVGKPRVNSRGVTVTLDLPDAGSVRLKVTTANGKRVLGTATKNVRKKGRVRVRVRVRRASGAKLRLNIVYTPTGGKPSTRTITVRR